MKTQGILYAHTENNENKGSTLAQQQQWQKFMDNPGGLLSDNLSRKNLLKKNRK